MAKSESIKPAATPAAVAPPTIASLPRLGESVSVKVADGAHLINNEAGALFVQGVPTLQTVTVTTLRRLQDGDLVLA